MTELNNEVKTKIPEFKIVFKGLGVLEAQFYLSCGLLKKVLVLRSRLVKSRKRRKMCSRSSPRELPYSKNMAVACGVRIPCSGLSINNYSLWQNILQATIHPD